MYFLKKTARSKILVVGIIVSGFFVVQSEIKAQAEDPCALDNGSLYSNTELDTEEIITLYHQTINEKFNQKITLMLRSESNAAKSGKINPEGFPPGKNPQGLPEVCSENNYSAYCVAENMLKNPGYGYMAYRKALMCRSFSLFETGKQQGIWENYVKGTVIGEQNEQEALDIYQSQKAITLNARAEAIDAEINNAKTVLDQTLSAYNELRTAWFMHQKYRELYNNLLQYRDKFVEIRHQVEQFSGKFIDATTTKCT